ncbi:MAG TPA: hypothetical protein VMW53_10450 [archaeon]|nr:hypothetical protein [archaeon]
MNTTQQPCQIRSNDDHTWGFKLRSQLLPFSQLARSSMITVAGSWQISRSSESSPGQLRSPRSCWPAGSLQAWPGCQIEVQPLTSAATRQSATPHTAALPAPAAAWASWISP